MSIIQEKEVVKFISKNKTSEFGAVLELMNLDHSIPKINVIGKTPNRIWYTDNENKKTVESLIERNQLQESIPDFKLLSRKRI